jgi:leader peptidase (prepilin peptidase)/N-methyltransferase
MDTPWEGAFGLAIAAGLGLSVGSFANVVVHRLPRDGLSVSRPVRSFCPSCSRQLSWFDNLPLVAWLALGGKCRTCKSPIPWRYPAVEAAVGALYVLLWWLAPPVDMGSTVTLLVGLLLAATCVIVSAIDIEHLIIPDAITLPGIGLGIVLSLVFPVLHLGHAGFDGGSPHGSALMLAVGGMLAGGGSLWLMGRLGNLMLKSQVEAAGVEDAMGLGDVKWMAATGTLLGPLGVLDAILAGCFIGALVGVIWKVVARMRGAPPPGGIPFGPFLCVGILAQLVQPGAAWLLISGLTPGPA